MTGEGAMAALAAPSRATLQGHALLEKMNSQITASADTSKEWRKRGLGSAGRQREGRAGLLKQNPCTRGTAVQWRRKMRATHRSSVVGEVNLLWVGRWGRQLDEEGNGSARRATREGNKRAHAQLIPPQPAAKDEK